MFASTLCITIYGLNTVSNGQGAPIVFFNCTIPKLQYLKLRVLKRENENFVFVIVLLTDKSLP